MAVGIYVGPNMTVDQYKEVVRRLKKAGAGHPAGRSYHATFGEKDKLAVFDVWSSQAAFDKFGKTLLPILEQMGVAAPQVNVMPIHNVIVPARKIAAKKPQGKRGKAAGRRQAR
jgi:hypothetical protein